MWQIDDVWWEEEKKNIGNFDNFLPSTLRMKAIDSVGVTNRLRTWIGNDNFVDWRTLLKNLVQTKVKDNIDVVLEQEIRFRKLS